jgi:hypothetical protein
MTTSTPASEITTLSSQSNTNVPPNNSYNTNSIVSHSTDPATTLSSPSSLSADIDVTTVKQQPHDDSLKVVPLVVNTTMTSSLANNDNDKETTETQTMDVNSNMKSINDDMMEQFVNNDSDKQANHHDLMIMMMTADGDDKVQHQEKEGRAINFPLEILSNNQNSTEPGHMQINYVTTSTEKTHVMSFFDLSDVSMDRDDVADNVDDDKKDGEHSNVKKDKKQGMTKDKIDGEKRNECSFNGTNYKVRDFFLLLTHF